MTRRKDRLPYQPPELLPKGPEVPYLRPHQIPRVKLTPLARTVPLNFTGVGLYEDKGKGTYAYIVFKGGVMLERYANEREAEDRFYVEADRARRVALAMQEAEENEEEE